MPRVEIYTKFWCGYCARAKRLLQGSGIEFEETDVSFDPVAEQEMIQRAHGRYTVPQIFIGEKSIGGYTELAALNRSGDLDAMLGGS